ncbi:hypothetical protein H5410_006321 [Solanum commersonii]|uniref:Uncharacterized protein n=1 Tax=Solanum commersonii TaxID=4109 RepID=A0A9J6AAZ4_SOLCO|nr:hypothetical protein H5410_006321 [Solanum commersonii]
MVSTWLSRNIAELGGISCEVETKKEKSFHLVKWEAMLLNKEEGGSDIRNLKMHNESLLMKWLWRHGREARLGKGDFPQTWCQMEWITNPINSPHGLGLWKYIKSLWLNFEHCGNQSGRSRRTKFWQDSWIGHRHTPLRVEYANLHKF